VSWGADNVVNLWSTTGQFLDQFSHPKTLLHVSASPLSVIMADDHRQIHTIDLADLTRTSFEVPALINCVAPIEDGIAALVALSPTNASFRHSICLTSLTAIRFTFDFAVDDNVVRILPLNVARDSGLITYLAIDKQGVITLRALEKILELEFAPRLTLLAESPALLVVAKDGKMYVYERDGLAVLSMMLSGHFEHPRDDIIAFLSTGR
jgi:hypothetical protein